MNQEKTNQNITDNLASDSHNNLDVMTESVVFDDTNSDLHSGIPSVLPKNNPHDSSSISLLATQSDSIHQNKVIEYNNSQSYYCLVKEIGSRLN